MTLSDSPEPAVLRLRDIDTRSVAALLSRFGLQVSVLADDAEIPGSYWGECEAGLIGDQLYARPDTPLHSILHEACHWITCTPERRATVHTDAADTEAEEGAIDAQTLEPLVRVADTDPEVAREIVAVIAAGADIAPGTRIINRDAKGEASLAFDDGCSITLAPGQVFTVGQASPCSFRAQEAGMGLSAPLLIGGLVITGAVIGGIVLATQKHDSRPWVPLSF